MSPSKQADLKMCTGLWSEPNMRSPCSTLAFMNMEYEGVSAQLSKNIGRRRCRINQPSFVVSTYTMQHKSKQLRTYAFALKSYTAIAENKKTMTWLQRSSGGHMSSGLMLILEHRRSMMIMTMNSLFSVKPIHTLCVRWLACTEGNLTEQYNTFILWNIFNISSCYQKSHQMNSFSKLLPCWNVLAVGLLNMLQVPQLLCFFNFWGMTMKRLFFILKIYKQWLTDEKKHVTCCALTFTDQAIHWPVVVFRHHLPPLGWCCLSCPSCWPKWCVFSGRRLGNLRQTASDPPGRAGPGLVPQEASGCHSSCLQGITNMSWSDYSLFP